MRRRSWRAPSYVGSRIGFAAPARHRSIGEARPDGRGGTNRRLAGPGALVLLCGQTKGRSPHMRPLSPLAVLATIAALAGGTAPAAAQIPKVTIYVAGTAGGGVDLYGR